VSAHDAWYLVVGGALWLRHTSPPGAVWFADFAGEPTARKVPYDGPLPFGDRLAGSCGDARWDLTLSGGDEPFPYFSGWLRRIASSIVDVERPSVRVDGWFETHGVRHELADARGEVARVRYRRQVDHWGWFHAALPDGGSLDGLVAKPIGLPRLAFHWRDGRRGRTSGSAAPGQLRVGPYVVEARREAFVGVTYPRAHCWHTERARLHGGGLDVENVALEYGSRARVDGWPISI
jgi:hypothetical protein